MLSGNIAQTYSLILFHAIAKTFAWLCQPQPTAHVGNNANYLYRPIRKFWADNKNNTLLCQGNKEILCMNNNWTDILNR